MVINDSAFAFLSYRWLLDHDVPLIGGGFNSNYYGAPGQREGDLRRWELATRSPGIQTTLTPKIMKSLGASKVAGIGYGVSPSSTSRGEGYCSSTRCRRSGWARVHEHVGRLRHQRRRAARARHEERRAPTPAGTQMDLEHQPRAGAGPAPERREDEGAADGDRLRARAARSSRCRRPSVPTSSSPPAGRRSS